MQEILVWTSANDQWTRQSIEGLVAYARTMVIYFEFEEIVNFVDGKPITYEQIAQYVADGINDDAPRGYWYTITADANLKLQTEQDI